MYGITRFDLPQFGYKKGVKNFRGDMFAAMVCKGEGMPSITWAWERSSQPPVFTTYRSLDGEI